MQFPSILSILFLAAPLIHAVALPEDGFNNKVEIRAGNTKSDADRVEKQYKEACQSYRNCIKGCETSSGYMTASGKVKDSAKKPQFKKCVKVSCDGINERADALMRQWMDIDNNIKDKKCAA